MQRLVLLSVIGLFCTQLFSQSISVEKKAKLEKLEQRVLEKDDKIEKVIISEERETPFMVTFDIERVDGHSISEAKSLIENFLELKTNEDRFEYSKTIKIKNNIEYQRFEQFYRDIKVEHGDYVALAKEGKLASLNGEYYDIDQIKTIPSLSEEEALELAKQAVGGSHFSWDFLEDNYNGVIAPELAARWHTMYEAYSPQTELVIVDDFDETGNNLDLAWKFNVYALSPKTVRDWVYVNAHTGKIMLRDPIIKHLGDNDPASAEVNTRYSKKQTIHTTEKAITLLSPTEPNPFFDPALGGPDLLLDGRGHVDFGPWTTETKCYVLIDQTRGGSNTTIETYDINGHGGVPLSLPIYGFGRSVTDDDNIWEDLEHNSGINGDINPAEREYDNDVAWDAHWGAGEVYDYWEKVHGRDSYDDNGATIYSFVHIGNAFDNAFWNGQVMSYGDGQSFKSLTSLDVCGHEVGHAVCTFTSNLVYALESGGMNEGFSDIWAACQEYFVIKKDLALAEPQGLDALTHPGGYEPFGIGEQIDPAGSGLRRMDNPKEAGDPDTYNGESFTRAEGCTPGLTNDQCGVHSNSGALNKWFYLLTVGSGAGSGPNAQYAGTGANADDEMADLVDGATITVDALPYSVTGLGFDKSEQIAFGCEVGLTSTATFAEARVVSIQFAKSVYGACSPEEQSTTDAWHAIGVGPAYVDCNADLIIGFSTPTTSVKETVFGVNECEPTQTIEVPIFLNPTSFNTTITIDPASTAEEGKDFTFSDLNVIHDGMEYETRVITVTIIDDGIQEGDGTPGTEETIILKIDNAITQEEFGTHTISIKDDDSPPTIGGIVTLYTNGMEITAGNLPVGMTAINPPGSPNLWTGGAALGTNLADGSGAIVDNQTTAGLTVAEYNPNAASDVILHTIDPINGQLLQNIKVTFNWGAGGEARLGLDGTEEPIDYGELMYSFDGTNFIETGHRFFKPFGQADAVSGTFSEIVPELENTEFYIGWKWINDDMLGGPQSFAIGDFDVTAELRGIETVPTSNVEERVDENTTVFFKSYQDGDIIARVTNPSEDLGCVEATVVESGANAQTLVIGTTSGDRSPKVFEISNDKFATYDLGLYATVQELGGLDENTLKIGKIIGSIDDPQGIIIDEQTTVEPIGSLGFQFISNASDGAFKGFSTFVLTNIEEVTICPNLPDGDNSIGRACDDLNPCTSNDTYTIDCECIGELDPNAITLAVTNTSDELCDNNMGEVTFSVNNATTYTITATDGTNTFTTDESNPTISGLSEGSYTAVVSNGTCESQPVSFVINNNSDFLIVNETIKHLDCFEDASGMIELNTGLAINPSFTWSHDANETGNTVSGLSAGIYSVTVSAAGSCDFNASYEITQPDVITSSFDKTIEQCGNAMASASVADIVGGNGGYIISWSTGSSDAMITGLSATNNPYGLTITDSKGCMQVRSFDIINTSDGFSVNAPTIVPVDCNGTSTGSITLSTLNTTGQTTFTWSNGQTTTSSGDAPTTLANLPAGDYTVMITDAAGCSVNDGPYTITEPTAIALAGLADQTKCFGEMATFMVTPSGGAGSFTYQWFNFVNGTGALLEGETNASLMVTASETTDYSVIVTDTNGCSETSDFVRLTVNALPTVTDLSDQSVCSGMTVDFTANPSGASPFNYQWRKDGTDISGANDATYTASDMGTYEVFITDDNGCSVTSNSANLTVNALPTFTIDVTDEQCGGGDGTAMLVPTNIATTNYTIDWSNSATGNQDNRSLSDLSAGAYTAQVTDDNTCVSQEVSFTIGNTSDGFSVQPTISPVDCNGANTGAITLQIVDSEATTINYMWSNNETTKDISDLAAGNYTVSIMDDVGCSQVVGPLEVTEPSVISLSETITDQTECDGTSNGSITVTPLGGTSATGDYDYVWNTGFSSTGTTGTLSNLDAGTYIVTVRDDNDCETVETYMVNCTPVILAVDLLDFKAQLTDKSNALLQWETANEQDLSHYEILRSTDNKDWMNLGKVAATGTNQYEFTDEQLLAQFNAGTTLYYQLKMVNEDASFDLSDVKNVVLPTKSTSMEVYPNPSSGEITVRFSTEQVKAADLRILSITGKVVQNFIIKNPSTLNRQALDLSILPKGVYFLQLRLEEGTQQVKVVLE